MSRLRIQLKCHQLINQINDDTLNNNILQILNELGGIRHMLLNNLHSFASENLLNTLNNIKKYGNNSSDDSNENIPVTLTSIPNEMILKVSQYLEISEVQHLVLTCIDLRLLCESELNKVDIRLVTYEDLILQYKLTFEPADFNSFGKIIRVNKTLTIDQMVRKHYKSKNYRGFWNVGNAELAECNPVFPVNNLASDAYTKTIDTMSGMKLQFFALNYQYYLTPIFDYKMDNTLMLIKYFDIRHQKLYNIDIVRLQDLSLMTQTILLNHVKTKLMDKYSEIFEPILKHENMLNDSRNFKFYQQNGFFSGDIIEIFQNGRNICDDNVVIFEINISNNESNKMRFKNDISKWKKELSNQNISFCPNVITFWSYHYGVYQLKRVHNIT